MDLVIVDTGCANIASVAFAIKRLGYRADISDQPQVIKQAKKVILPGVGTAQAAMEDIRGKDLLSHIQALTQPVLGICLGMQLLCRDSVENNRATSTDCLDLIPASVTEIKAGDLRLPHMGWNQVTQISDSPLFEGIDDRSYFYFVHSYSVPEGDFTLATCSYGSPFSAVIQQDNFYGAQFHPERSGDAGAQLLRNFIEKV